MACPITGTWKAGDDQPMDEIRRGVGEEGVALKILRVRVAAIDRGAARALDHGGRSVLAEERIAITAIDAAIASHRKHRRVLLFDQQLVEAARPDRVGIAQEIA